MKRKQPLILAAMVLAAVSLAAEGGASHGGGHGGHGGRHGAGRSGRAAHGATRYMGHKPCFLCSRDHRNRILRSEQARDAFMKETGFPHGRPGYVIDHIIPLAKGGADLPSNMQWQTIAEAKAKDAWELK
jgi:hypothetical protein